MKSKKIAKLFVFVAVCLLMASALTGCLITNNKKESSNANEDNVIPPEYKVDSSKGTVIEINYPTRDYTVEEKDWTDACEYEKHALVYLPAGYDPSDKETKYPLLILMHGAGGNEWSWGLQNEAEVRHSLDDGIASGKVKKMIVVTPNGVADKTWTQNGSSNWYGVINFGGELRDDLIPYLRQHFNILDGRENVAMAGLSQGAEQTLGIGIWQCLHLISYFGAFSSIPFSVPSNPSTPYKEPSVYMNDVEQAYPDKNLTIKLLYMTCGTEDEGFYPGYSDYIKVMPEWDKIEKFESETIQGLGHEWDVWTNGFDHFIQMIFK